MGAALGAEIRGVDLTKIDDTTFDALHKVWLEHMLLLFRGQKFAPEDLVTLVKRFGTPVTSSTLHKRDLAERIANQVFQLPPEVTVVTNVRENGKPVGILGDGEVVWHSDFSFKDKPTAARMLLAVEIPPAGEGPHRHRVCRLAQRHRRQRHRRDPRRVRRCPGGHRDAGESSDPGDRIVWRGDPGATAGRRWHHRTHCLGALQRRQPHRLYPGRGRLRLGDHPRATSARNTKASRLSICAGRYGFCWHQSKSESQ